MFWECHVATSSIDKLLELPNDERKLQNFLDESDLIQECLNQNKLLLDYLVQDDVIQELIRHVITVPSDANYRNANVVSELLSGDFQRVQDALLEKEQLNLLYSFLLSTEEQTLNPILASYFTRILNTLIIRKPNEMLTYFKSRQTFKEDFFRHLDSTPVTDILYHLISDSSEQRSDVIKWYEDINLIDGLIEQLLIAESKSIQINITSLLSELLRLAFDQQVGIDFDAAGPTLSATIERLLYGRTDSSNQGTLSARHYSSSSDDEKKSTAADNEEKLTPVVLAQHILSKYNLERIFDTLSNRPILIAVGCEFLESILDLLNRQMPVPICISLTSNRDEPMQIDDESETSPVNKSVENETALANLAKDPLVRIYFTFIEVISSRLPSLINLLSLIPSQPLISTNDNSSTVKYQFIYEPLGSTRLNLIKFFSKLVSTIANDYFGDHIYEIINKNRLFPILIDLFLRHEYNNFLHTQVYFTIRSIVQNNSIAVKQSTDLWTRSKIDKTDQYSESSPFHYKNRYLYKLLQSLLNPKELNLFERLFDHYETTKSKTNNENNRFTSPNIGHVAQILRYLRDHASIFDNYSTVFQHTDENTNSLEQRWQAILGQLGEDEKKCLAMHPNERTTSSFRSTTSSFLTHMGSATDNTEASLRRQTFHMKSFATKPLTDDDEEDDEEVERLDIDDELMKSDQTTNEKKVTEMKKISFEPAFPLQPNEDELWYQASNDDTQTKKASNNLSDENKLPTPPMLPDLFENHRMQQERAATSTTETNFEQLCSLRVNENNSESGFFPFQSSSTLRDEASSSNDFFWKDRPIFLANSNQNRSPTSSDEGSDDDHESKHDFNISDDEKYFVDNETKPMEAVQSNNMMDIFQRQSSNSVETSSREPRSSSTPERQTNNSNVSSDRQENGNVNSADTEDDDLELQDNFSFLIAKGMLKRSSSSSS
ncbi:unnamed protein product [Adineta ricciae]|uniref:Uncharacterized protein n=1 Tax=Adineta ricciae TaxID=249248 RepID=A0A814PSL9_ADIRI|nr:unnamed protein product [Adineta ricciae]